jgi:malate dehydrogenase (oxaloacetate-decarboxylating)
VSHPPVAPGAAYSVTIRLEAPTDPQLLPRIAQTVTSEGAVVVAMDLVDVSVGGAVVDVTLQAHDEAHVSRLERALTAADMRVRNTSDRVFLYHLGGKIEVTPRRTVRTRDDMSMAYTPGVGRISTAIAEDPERAWRLTAKGTSVAIVTNGSAVLGLGNLGPLAALPVMEGKAVIFKQFGNVNAYPLCLDVPSTQALIDATLAIAPGFGGINLEDIKAPECFEVELALQAQLDIPVFHDDQHGTAIVVLAGLINACRLTGRELKRTRVVVVGVGAAGTAITLALIDAGVGDVIAVDKDGPLTRERPSTLPHHQRIADCTNPRGVTTLTDALKGADVFIGAAMRGSVDPELLWTMAPRPIVFALSNPVPEVFAEEMPDGALFATGRSDYPNQVNNSLCFPGFFRGALDARARSVTSEMKLAATRAIADTVTDEQLSVGVIIPSMFASNVHDRVAKAVAEAAGAPASKVDRA